MHVKDYITYVQNKEDLPYLRSRLLDVNMRLFASSNNYRRIVQGCCRYLSKLALAEMEGYKKPHGMSGANVGIPFNIIGIVRKRGTKDEYCEIMINPKITFYSKEKEIGQSNCGSIRLPEPIPVERSKNIVVEWYDVDGGLRKAAFSRDMAAFTIQHEVDHNKGILITDKITDTCRIEENIF